jgi:squalene-hopene/tetraprenyl-beta-curcumene cyclase
MLRDGVDRIVDALASRLEEMGNTLSEKNLRRYAIITNALSHCYGRTTSRSSLAQEGPSSSHSPFVSAPRPFEEALRAGLRFLKDNQQEGRFGFSGFPDPGISALATSSVIRSSRLLNQQSPAYVEEGLRYLKGLQKEDGSIFLHGLANYVTSVSIMAFVDSEDPKFEPAIEAAKGFLLVLQADEDEGYSVEEDYHYGGLGYGGDERPDLSNTQLSLEALKTAGLESDHETFLKAIRFLQRCQNLSEVNPTKVQISPTEKVISGNDGGGTYAPGDSKADLEKISEGVYVARSYGSMTYALLKSYIFAGLDREDPRVKAAIKWIQNHYTLEENPGFKHLPDKDLGQQGIYYYYLTLARALNAAGIEAIETEDGESHPWRNELEKKILKLQRTDGSWVNTRSSRWFEGNPVLATSYALLVLDACRKK